MYISYICIHFPLVPGYSGFQRHQGNFTFQHTKKRTKVLATKAKDESAAAKPKDMDPLLGLDMLKRFNCSIDLLEHKLKSERSQSQ